MSRRAEQQHSRSYPRGTKVTVLSNNGNWSKVSVDGKTGYMQTQWLSTKSVSSGSSTVKPATGTAVVNNPRDTQVLFLRREASANSESLGYYRNGKTVTLLARQGDWYKVSVDGKTGFMMAKYLKVTNEVVSGTARVFNANGGSYVNFRSRASLCPRPSSAVPVGDGQSAGKTTDWTKVEVNGQTGYISTWFLKF
ncbi:MAG: SH3 domain-containing protein [Christensenellales bacterium]